MEKNNFVALVAEVKHEHYTDTAVLLLTEEMACKVTEKVVETVLKVMYDGYCTGVSVQYVQVGSDAYNNFMLRMLSNVENNHSDVACLLDMLVTTVNKIL